MTMVKYFLIVTLFLFSCTSSKKPADQPFQSLTNLLDSTTIIRDLIIQHKVSQLLENHNPEQLEALINNFSPASMAFESEILSTTFPLVAVYYFKEGFDQHVFLHQLDKLALELNNNVKFVIIDVEKLFSLASDAKITHFPTLVLVKNRKIIERISDNLSIEVLHQKILRYL